MLDLIDHAQNSEGVNNSDALEVHQSNRQADDRKQSAFMKRRAELGKAQDCFLCDEAIEPARRKALPTTPICAECAKQQESRKLAWM